MNVFLIFILFSDLGCTKRKHFIRNQHCFIPHPTLLYVVSIHTSGNSLFLLPLQQWASLYQPLIFSSEVGATDTTGDVHLNKLDPTKAFRGKAKAPVPKKKQPAQCSSGAAAAATKSSAGKQTGTKRWEESRLKTFRQVLSSKLCGDLLAVHSLSHLYN